METIEWQAREFVQPERHPNWFISLWIIAGGLVIVALILKSFLMTVFVLLATAVVNIFALKEPRTFRFSLSADALKIGGKNYNLKDFDSYWIFEAPDGNILSFEAKKFLRPFLQIPLGSIEPETIRNRLSGIIEEKEQQESVIDVFSRWLRF